MNPLFFPVLSERSIPFFVMNPFFHLFSRSSLSPFFLLETFCSISCLGALYPPFPFMNPFVYTLFLQLSFPSLTVSTRLLTPCANVYAQFSVLTLRRACLKKQCCRSRPISNLLALAHGRIWLQNTNRQDKRSGSRGGQRHGGSGRGRGAGWSKTTKTISNIQKLN